MTPITDFVVLDWVKLVACVLLVAAWLLQLRRDRSGTPDASARGFELDPAFLIVALGALLPWRDAIRDAIVLTGCAAWLLSAAARRLRR